MGRAFGVEIEHVPVEMLREPALELHQRQIFRARVQTVKVELCFSRQGQSGKVLALLPSVDSNVYLIRRLG